METKLPAMEFEDFKQALRAYLEGAGEKALAEAYAQGRRALANDQGLLELVESQLRALVELLEENGAGGFASELARKMASFLIESLSPFEMAHRSYKEANAVLHRLNDLLEEQAKRIAHALHDDSGQLLAAAQIALDRQCRDLPPDARKGLEEIKNLLKMLDETLRRLSHELRPTILDDMGLVPALEFLADGVRRRTGLDVGVDARLDSRLPPRLEVVLYRIVQEALTNILKHARAARVAIRLEQVGGFARCSVRDDGVGFNPPEAAGKKGSRGIGLIGMQERLNPLCGTLEIETSPSRGTELRIRIPITEETHDGTNSAR